MEDASTRPQPADRSKRAPPPPGTYLPPLEDDVSTTSDPSSDFTSETDDPLDKQDHPSGDDKSSSDSDGAPTAAPGGGGGAFEDTLQVQEQAASAPLEVDEGARPMSSRGGRGHPPKLTKSHGGHEMKPRGETRMALEKRRQARTASVHRTLRLLGLKKADHHRREASIVDDPPYPSVDGGPPPRRPSLSASSSKLQGPKPSASSSPPPPGPTGEATAATEPFAVTWLFDVPLSAVALQFTSFAIFPAFWTPRIVGYNIFKHRVVEHFILLMILGNCTAQAFAPRALVEKPAFMKLVEIVFAGAMTLEVVGKMFIYGVAWHPGAFFRSGQHVFDFLILVFSYLTFVPGVGNYTALRSFRLLLPLRSGKFGLPLGREIIHGLFRSFRPLSYFLLYLVITLTSFALFGLQMWAGKFHFYCATDPRLGNMTVTSQLCRPVAGTTSSSPENLNAYWGRPCPAPLVCVEMSSSTAPRHGLLTYDNFLISLLNVFEISQVDGWREHLWATYDVSTMLTFLFFFSLIVIGAYCIPGLALAIVSLQITAAVDASTAVEKAKHAALEEEHVQQRIKQLNLRKLKGRLENGELVDSLSPSHLQSTGSSEAQSTDTKGALDKRHQHHHSKTPKSQTPLRSKTPDARLQLKLALERKVPALLREQRKDEKKALEERELNNRPASVPPRPSSSRPLHSSSSERPPLGDTRTSRPPTAQSLRPPSTKGGSRIRVGSLLDSYMAPTDQEPSSAILLMREDVDVVPLSCVSRTSRKSQGTRPSSSSMPRSRPPSGLPPKRPSSTVDESLPSIPTPKQEGIAKQEGGQEEEKPEEGLVMITVQDPDGGVWESTMSWKEKFDVIQNALHLFTEGYPRVISVYIHDLRKRQRKAAEDAEKGEGTAPVLSQDSNSLENIPADVLAQRIQDITELPPFARTMFCLIVLNFAILCVTYYPGNYYLSWFLSALNLILTLGFFVEFNFRLIALGPEMYFADPYNRIDCLITIAGLLELGFAQSNAVGTLRLLRFIRLLNMAFIPAAREVVAVAVNAMKATLMLTAILMVFLCTATILAMNLFSNKLTNMFPVETRDIEEGNITHHIIAKLDTYGEPLRAHFDSFFPAFYAIFQVFIRDDWMQVSYNCIEATSGNWASVLFFVLIVFIARYLIYPLYSSVIILCFEQHAEADRSLLTAFDSPYAISFSQSGAFFDFTLKAKLQQLLRRAPDAEPQPPQNFIFPNVDLLKRQESVRLSRANSIVQVPIHQLSETVADSAQLRNGDIPLIPLPAPPLVQQRSSFQLQREIGVAAELRVAKLKVLRAIEEIIAETTVPPSPQTIEFLLGHAWENGLLLNSRSEDLVSAPATRSSFFLQAIALQRDALNLCVGEEEVGRFITASMCSSFGLQPERFVLSSSKAVKTREWLRSIPGIQWLVDPQKGIQRRISPYVNTVAFELFFLVCIMASSVVLIYLPDPPPTSVPLLQLSSLQGADVFFTAVFTLELFLRFLASETIWVDPVSFFISMWNFVDLIVVVTSIITWGARVNIAYLKVLRLFRLVRPLGFLPAYLESIRNVAMTVMRSAGATFGISCLAVFLHLCFAIMGVVMFGGKFYSCSDPAIENQSDCLNSSYIPNTTFSNSSAVHIILNSTTNESAWFCFRNWTNKERHFDHLGASLLTLMEVATGEKVMPVVWAAVDSRAHGVSPKRGSNPWAGLFFVLFYITVNLFFLNLYLGSIVRYLRDSTTNRNTTTSHSQQEWIAQQRLLLRFRPPMHLAPEGPLSFATHKVVSHPVWYWTMWAIAVCALVFQCIEFFGEPRALGSAIQVTSFVVLGAFGLECLLGYLSYGTRYFRSSLWYRLDLLLVVLGLVRELRNNVNLDSGASYDSNISSAKPFSIDFFGLCTFRLLRSLGTFGTRDSVIIGRKMRIFNFTIISSAPSLLNVTVLLTLVCYVFSIIALHIFGDMHHGDIFSSPYGRFDNMRYALQLMFVFSTREGWVEAERDIMRNTDRCRLEHMGSSRCGSVFAGVFFVPFVVISVYIVGNIITAVVLDAYTSAVALEHSSTKMDEIHRLVGVWSRFDHDGTLVIPTSKLRGVLAAMGLPLGIQRKHHPYEIITKCLKYKIPERGGFVHFMEVLIPIARASAEIEFSEADERQQLMLWRESLPELQSLPIARIGGLETTAAHHFASEVFAAAYKRRIACRVVQDLRREQWEMALEHCSMHGISPEHFCSNGHCLVTNAGEVVVPHVWGKDVVLSEAERRRALRAPPPRVPQDIATLRAVLRYVERDLGRPATFGPMLKRKTVEEQPEGEETLHVSDEVLKELKERVLRGGSTDRVSESAAKRKGPAFLSAVVSEVRGGISKVASVVGESNNNDTATNPLFEPNGEPVPMERVSTTLPGLKFPAPVQYPWVTAPPKKFGPMSAERIRRGLRRTELLNRRHGQVEGLDVQPPLIYPPNEWAEFVEKKEFKK